MSQNKHVDQCKIERSDRESLYAIEWTPSGKLMQSTRINTMLQLEGITLKTQ